MLEDCIVLGIKLTFNSRSLLQHSETSEYSSGEKTSYLHPLLEVSILALNVLPI